MQSEFNVKKQQKYGYRRFLGHWNVYEYEYTGNIASGTKIAEFRTQEEAKALVYQLNGWKIKS